MSLTLQRLRLRNVRSYEAADLDLGPGVTVLTGDVGSGKTSLLHGVEMALFGFAEVEAPYLVRHRSGEASVTLTLADDEHSYELGRTFRRKTRRGREVFDPEEPTFRVDGALRRYSATEFRQRVIELVGFPDNPNPRSRSDLWRWAIYTPQERMREILGLSEADARLETIRKALGLERYRRAADNADVVAVGVRAEARSRSDVATGLQHFERDLADADAALAVARVALQGREADAADARRHRAELEELLHASERDRRRRDADRAERDRLARELPKLLAEVETARGRVRGALAERDRRQLELTRALAEVQTREAAGEALRQAEAEVRERTGVVTALDEAAHALAVADEQRAGARRASEAAERVAAAAEEEQRTAEAALASANSRGPAREPTPPTTRTVEALTDRLESLRATERERLERWTACQSEAAEVRSLLALGVCPRCHQTVEPDEFRSHLTEAEEALTAARSELDATRAELGATETERASRERFDRAYLAWSSHEEARAAASQVVRRAMERRALAERDRTTARARGEDAESAVAATRERAAPRDAAVRARTDAETVMTAARLRLAAADRASAAQDALGTALETAVARWTAEVERVAEAERTQRGVSESLSTLEASLGAAGEADRAHAELTGRLETARAGEIEATSRVASARERATSAEARRLEAERGVLERRGHLDASERLQKAAAFLAGPFRDALLDLERRRLSRAQASFERSFSRSFAALVEDPGLVARCGPSFVPYVEIDGTWTPAEALSGGERTALALAFRLALGDVVRTASPLRLDTIVLDEPTDGFSPEQVARMGELLRGLPWRQVLVVTHETALAAIADRTVRVTKVNGVSALSGDGVRRPEDPAAPTPRRRSTPLSATPSEG